jgi:hypothetical protein
MRRSNLPAVSKMPPMTASITAAAMIPADRFMGMS